MSLTKLPLGRKNIFMTSLFPLVTSRLGTGNSRTFFYGAWTSSCIKNYRFKGAVSPDGLRYCWHVWLDLSLNKTRGWFSNFFLCQYKLAL
jgi:hypothetical protein